MQSDSGVTVDNEPIEVVGYFKYLGSLKSADGNNCSKDTRSRIGMANKRMLDLVGETGGNCNIFHINADYVEHVFY